MKIYHTILIILLIDYSSVLGQNLPSLLTDKNFNTTFSIVAYDKNTHEFGISVATNNMAVGSSTIYIEPELGAFSIIAETDPKYAMLGFEMLKEGKPIKQAITEIRNGDDGANYRQVSGMDAKGGLFAFTGTSLKYWQGNAGHLLDTDHIVMGNQLADGVLTAMSTIFKNTSGTLAQRLLKSLQAGENAGGQVSGKQSAAIVVKGSDNEWFNQIDLRVDNSKNPIQELNTLMDYHYGRIRLNQSLYAQREGNSKRAKIKLSEAETMLDGWTGMYAKIAKAHIALGDEDSAVKWVQKGLEENPKWNVYLPTFYCLKEHPKMALLLKPKTFTHKDWESALMLLSNLGRELEVIQLGEKLIRENMKSSYLYFLLGRSHFYEKEPKKAVAYLEKALEMDNKNTEAQHLLNKLKN